MTASTLPPPNRRLIGWLALAVVVAIAVATPLVVYSQRSVTSVNSPARAVSPPASSVPAATGTANSGLSTEQYRAGGSSGGPGGESTCLTVVRHTRIC
jgi:hypothetical protein